MQLVDNLVEYILKYEEALAGTHIVLDLGNLICYRIITLTCKTKKCQKIYSRSQKIQKLNLICKCVFIEDHI